MAFGPELIVIVLILVMVFGASRIPAIGAGLGTGIREFKDNLTDGSKEDKDSADQRRLKD